MLDIDNPGDGTAHLYFDGGGDKGAHGPSIGREHIDVLLTCLAGLADQGEDLFDFLVLRSDKERHVALPKESPR